ncbi:AbrB/MazE/SpoVT family DNA-binding domain-containing protein [Leptospira langatensis]|uniref:AbrB/MazE/SpoVT family DNA-binding domain-containing protein n=1 Tax=Leptospira langatensis TaxID=2484983 RepID=A0A5F1ZSF2_9LEPT|nr:AbrB/MazE/SpoVT family DNA-binding domain-containing protein [Leptospira langatensis]TGK01876.1 AbrB/MazE/SpoVT family DNA-binding domain-containing protein [Leptospira langatensis]TGL39481.1 AbrB/MazE/SpoVT family DNA-binding domain-containing protein [Leptospira langatensis]
MKAAIVQIGNSKGIRIPKTVLVECQIEDEVDLIVEKNKLIVVPLKSKPRQGWENQFKAMADHKDDTLLISDSMDLSDKDWEW